MPRFDCQACGACCCNTAYNTANRTQEYVEVTRDDRLFAENKERLKELTVRNEAGLRHMKLIGAEQRCVALEGVLQERVGCTIYALRPSGCRTVEQGDEECLKARRRLGLPVTRAAEEERLRT